MAVQHFENKIAAETHLANKGFSSPELKDLRWWVKGTLRARTAYAYGEKVCVYIWEA